MKRERRKEKLHRQQYNHKQETIFRKKGERSSLVLPVKITPLLLILRQITHTPPFRFHFYTISIMESNFYFTEDVKIIKIFTLRNHIMTKRILKVNAEIKHIIFKKIAIVFQLHL